MRLLGRIAVLAGLAAIQCEACPWMAFVFYADSWPVEKTVVPDLGLMTYKIEIPFTSPKDTPFLGLFGDLLLGEFACFDAGCINNWSIELRGDTAGSPGDLMESVHIPGPSWTDSPVHSMLFSGAPYWIVATLATWYPDPVLPPTPDSTQVYFIVVGVPEPESWLLVACGFAVMAVGYQFPMRRTRPKL